MRPPVAAGVLALLAGSGCALVGYPAGVPGAEGEPVPVAERSKDGSADQGSTGGSPAGRAERPPARSADAARDGSAAPGDARPAGARRRLTDAEIDAIPDAIPVEEARSAYGNPPAYEVDGRTYHVMESAGGYQAEGVASWYGNEFQGRPTSSGEPYDMYRMTAAHPTLPIPTYVEVTNLENGRVVVVRVNDRGPFHAGRIVDLSYVAARKLGIVGPGTARVRVRALVPGG